MPQEDRLTGLVGYSGMKVPVALATTAAITLSGEQTIDGVAAVTGDRVLVKDQADQTENGIYVVDTGDWNRAADCDGPYDLVQGSVVYVNEGSTNTGFWYCTSADPITVDSSNITWARASSVLATVSAYIQTLLDDTTAAAARTTLDASQLTSSRSEDTAPDLIADFVGSYDTSASSEKKIRLATLLGLAAPPGQGVLLNGLVVTSVGSNALTIAIKGADGNDPSASNPVFVAFRSATLGTAGFTLRKITAALSMTVSSGSTLGHASGSACHLFAYLIDNSGTVEVAVSNLPPDYPGTFANTRLISTTAEGGAGAADSATGIYSTPGRSNVPWVCVAMCKSTQTTAGTWAANMTQVDQAPFRIPTCAFSAYKSSTQSVGISTLTKFQFNTENFDPDATYDAATNYRHQPNVAGLYRYQHKNYTNMGSAGSQFRPHVLLNGTTSLDVGYGVAAASAGLQEKTVSATVFMNGTTDYVEGHVFQNDSNPLDVGDGNSYNARLEGCRISGGQ